MAVLSTIYNPTDAVSQATSITTAVTSNFLSGVITTQAANAAAGGNHQFTLNNSQIGPNSAVQVGVAGYSGTYTTNGLPFANSHSVTSGSAVIVIGNAHSANALSGTLKIVYDIS